jgi:uncharacterized protein YjbI with pentapeptide repeats
MSQCEHYEICGLDANPGEDLCILHSHHPDKDISDFDEALAAHRDKNGHNFQYFVFPRHAAYFKAARFSEWAVFFYAVFAEGCDFSDATFSEGADFAHARFTDSAKFFGVTFDKGAKFSYATFCEGTFVDFGAARFADWAYFSNATFGGEKVVNSANARFIDEFASADAAIYAGGAKFRDIFNGEAYFHGTIFNEETWFGGATFAKGADFSGTLFSKGAEFCRARFLGRTLFASRKEEGRTIPIFSETVVDFSEVDIAPLDAVVFRDADLRKCLFMGTDLRKAEFAGVTWPEISPKRWPKIGRRLGVYDQVWAEQKDDNASVPHIEQLYRQLKQNHEDRRDYESAGDFHYGEKEMRRKNSRRGSWFFLTLYWLASGYGERYWRPVICATILLAICAAGYVVLGLVPAGKGASLALSWKSGWDWLRGLHYSFQVMTLLKPEDLVPIGYAKAVRTFEMLAGPILLGLFPLALRQRLKR